RQEISVLAFEVRVALGVRRIAIMSGTVYPLPSIFQCPECDSALKFEVEAWATDDGEPMEVRVFCKREWEEFVDPHRHLVESHRRTWDLWMNVTTSAERWVGRRCRVVECRHSATIDGEKTK